MQDIIICGREMIKDSMHLISDRLLGENLVGVTMASILRDGGTIQRAHFNASVIIIANAAVFYTQYKFAA